MRCLPSLSRKRVVGADRSFFVVVYFFGARKVWSVDDLLRLVWSEYSNNGRFLLCERQSIFESRPKIRKKNSLLSILTL